MISDAVQLATERAWREQEALGASTVQQLSLPGISEEIRSYDSGIAEIIHQVDGAVKQRCFAGTLETDVNRIDDDTLILRAAKTISQTRIGRQ